MPAHPNEGANKWSDPVRGSRYYLDGHVVLPWPDPDDQQGWAAWVQSSERERIVGKDYIGSARILTVFTGLDFQFGRSEKPAVFDTTDSLDSWLARSGTWLDAEKTHVVCRDRAARRLIESKNAERDRRALEERNKNVAINVPPAPGRLGKIKDEMLRVMQDMNSQVTVEQMRLAEKEKEQRVRAMIDQARNTIGPDWPTEGYVTRRYLPFGQAVAPKQKKEKKPDAKPDWPPKRKLDLD